VTLAHEALLSQWGKLRGWVAEAREDRLLADELERDAEKWKADPEVVQLWQRRRLAFGEELRRRGFVEVSSAAAEFLKRSRRAERRVRLLVGGLGSLLALSLFSIGALHARTMQVKEEAARNAYNNERQNREYAEQQTRRIQEDQAKIDQLLKDLDNSSTKEAVMELQRQIRATETSAELSSRSIVGSGRPSTAASPSPGASSREVAPPASASAPAPGIKPQTTWD